MGIRRVTLALDDDLLRALKARAGQKGLTLSRVANELLRQAQAPPVRPVEPYRFRMAVHVGGPDDGLQPGVDLADRKSLYDAMGGTDGNGA